MEASRWVIRGSRLLDERPGRTRAAAGTSEVIGYAPKRLPPGSSLTRHIPRVRCRGCRRFAGMSHGRVAPDLHHQVRSEDQAAAD